MRDNNVGPARDHTNEIRRLATLLEISQAVSGVLNLKSALHSVLAILQRRHEVTAGAVLLPVELPHELEAEAAIGMRQAGGRAANRPGGAIATRVMESGKAVVVPQVSREPALAGRYNRGERQERTFIAVPIPLSRRAAGVLEILLRFKADRDYQRSLEFYRLVSSMIAQAVKSSRLVQADRHRLAEENEHLRDELRERHAFRHIVGNSAPIQQVYEQVTQVARSNTTVLIRGESGTGKEMIAHAIHYNSPRARKPFVKVSCAALPDSLIESELFGYERGAFTGAQGSKKGRFELADGGTLFLDEIGDLNTSTQVKLLRVLQEREIERLGSTTSIKINVRLIAATHQPLETLIEGGRFRADLYYRLAVFTIFAPPLRERKPDIMLLVDHFLEKHAREQGKRIRRVATPAIDMLTSYHWPGNVRELENTLERAVLVCEGGVIHGHHLPPTLQTAEASGTVPRVSLRESVEAFERDLLQDALKSSRGNCARAARQLGTTERIINYKVRKHRIDADRFRG